MKLACIVSCHYLLNQKGANNRASPSPLLWSYAGHCFAKDCGYAAAAPRVARRAKRGGARRSRTDDILLAKQALYQLSYGPLVGPTRFELVTSRLSSVRSNQLSYGPIGRSDQIQRMDPLQGSRSCFEPDRLETSGKRNGDGGDPLICVRLAH